MKKILLTGATGQLGRIVIDKLLLRVEPQEIAVMVRNAAKAENWKKAGIKVLTGDYTDVHSLRKAFEDTEKLYFISSSDKADRLGQHKNVINSAVEVGVGHVIYTSAFRKLDGPESLLTSDAHWQTDALIRSSGLNYTILKHSLYSELLPLFMGNILETGEINLPAGNGSASYASREDLAQAGAVVLTMSGHKNSTYNLSDSSSYSFRDLAKIMSDLSGKKIIYSDLQENEYVREMASRGQPDQLINGILHFCHALKEGEFDHPSTDLEQLLGRRPESMKDFLKRAYLL